MPTFLEIARHEAAHAVVFARLGISVVEVSNRPKAVPLSRLDPATGQEQTGILRLYGSCLIHIPDLEGIVRRLPEPASRLLLTQKAIGAAAGPACDRDRGWPPIALEVDHAELKQIGYFLGVSPAAREQPLRVESGQLVFSAEAMELAFPEPEFVEWVNARISDATSILTSDGCAAWDAVTSTLATEGVLTGEAVSRLILASDSTGPRG